MANLKAKVIIGVIFILILLVALFDTTEFWGAPARKPSEDAKAHKYTEIINIQGIKYTIEPINPVRRNYENGQKLYKAEDGTYIAYAVIAVHEYEASECDSNGNWYNAGTRTDYDYEWKIANESWNVNLIDATNNPNIGAGRVILSDNK